MQDSKEQTLVAPCEHFTPSSEAGSLMQAEVLPNSSRLWQVGTNPEWVFERVLVMAGEEMRKK